MMNDVGRADPPSCYSINEGLKGWGDDGAQGTSASWYDKILKQASSEIVLFW